MRRELMYCDRLGADWFDDFLEVDESGVDALYERDFF